jgi:hypothetical protein
MRSSRRWRLPHPASQPRAEPSRSARTMIPERSGHHNVCPQWRRDRQRRENFRWCWCSISGLAPTWLADTGRTLSAASLACSSTRRMMIAAALVSSPSRRYPAWPDAAQPPGRLTAAPGTSGGRHGHMALPQLAAQEHGPMSLRMVYRTGGSACEAEEGKPGTGACCAAGRRLDDHQTLIRTLAATRLTAHKQ